MRLKLNPIFKPCPRSFEFGKKVPEMKLYAWKFRKTKLKPTPQKLTQKLRFLLSKLGLKVF
jgi:hypothetical protein